MSQESEHPKSKQIRRRPRSLKRRLRRWWSGFWLPRLFSRLTYWLYELWFPLSESSHDNYGYGGRVPQNRIKWLWRRLKRATRHSFVGSTYRAWRKRWYDPLFCRLEEWWYPLEHETHAYPAYARPRRNRLQLAWHRTERRINSSWLGRKYEQLTGNFYQWYFPLEKGSAGYPSFRRISRPKRWLRRALRWYRRTWIGHKTGWVLDEVDDLILEVRIQVAEDFTARRIQERVKRWQTWATLACLVAAIVLGSQYGLPRYRHFKEQMFARQVQMFVAKRDFSRAVLRARQVLILNRDNVVAIRAFAEMADAVGSPHALDWWQRLVVLNADPTNRLALARTALRAEGFPFSTTTKALREIASTNRQNSAYQLVAGALAIKLNNLPEAEQHYATALKFNPDDPVSRMSLAVARLQTGNPRLIADSRTTLELLSTDRQLGLLAKRSLVAESLLRRDFGRAAALSQQIVTNQQVLFGDRIVHLTILKMEMSPDFEKFLVETEKYAGENPFYVGEMASWMTSSGHAQAALEWIKSLPVRLTRQGEVPIVIADAYVALGKWEELAHYLKNERWNELDPIRMGMLSLASSKIFGNKRLSTWGEAILLAARSPDTLNSLARMASAWGWKEETADVFWFAARQYPDQSWPLTSLEKLYAGQRDTAGLRRVFQVMAQKNPRDAQAQNNFAMVSMLLGQDVAGARQAAAKVYAAEPENPAFTSTYAFSLYQQGHPQQAVEVLRKLGLDRLDDPSLAAYYGIFLAAAGDKQTAKVYLGKSARAFLLPEELALVQRAKKEM